MATNNRSYARRTISKISKMKNNDGESLDIRELYAICKKSKLGSLHQTCGYIIKTYDNDNVTIQPKPLLLSKKMILKFKEEGWII